MRATTGLTGGIAPGGGDYRRLVVAMFLAGVATFAQMYSTQGVLPEIARAFGTTASDAALSVAAVTLGVAVGVLPWSYVADRIGARRALLAALCLAIAPGFAAPLVPSFGGFIALRFVEGLGIAGVPAIAIGFVLGAVRSPHGAAAGATYIAGTTIGGLLGRLIAAPIAEQLGWRPAILAVMAVCAAATLGFAALLPAAARSAPSPARLATVALLLRDPRQLALQAVAFLAMGGFVSLYNYIGFRLVQDPYALSPSIVALVFLAYLAGTWSSSAAGRAMVRWGRPRVALAGAAVMAAGVGAMFAAELVVIVVGLTVATAGFFALHAVASGWAPATASDGRNQASALYNLAYYGGSSLLGWATGYAFVAFGWGGVGIAVLVAIGVVLVLLAVLALGDRGARRRATHASVA